MLYRNKKENDLNEGKWVGVGGKFEPGETAEQCLVREVREGDIYFLKEMLSGTEKISMTLRYEGDTLKEMINE